MEKNIVAIVGKPNVGKSSLFNRLIKKRHAITGEMPGVTRDSIYQEFNFKNKLITLIDTGGLEQSNSFFQKKIKSQIEIAVKKANVILFMVEGNTATTYEDLIIAKLLRKKFNDKKIILVANKIEGKKTIDSSVYKLGFEEMLTISVLHNLNIDKLLNIIYKNLSSKKTLNEKSNFFKLAIIGKPNAGKSTLFNSLIEEERSIVSKIPGTTRDIIGSEFKIANQDFKLVDTAGIIKKSKTKLNIEKYMINRSIQAIKEADLVIHIIDATNKISHFDAKIGGYIFEFKKPLIFVMNKWDLVNNEDGQEFKRVTKEMEKNFKFLKWAPIVFASALTKKNLKKIKELILEIKKELKVKIKTSDLNKFIKYIDSQTPVSALKNIRCKLTFMQQVKGKIPTFVISGKNADKLHFSFKRFIENQIYEQFTLKNVPIRLIFKSYLN